MHENKNINTHEVPHSQGASLAEEDLSAHNIPDCCQETISLHVTHNPMMVCPSCKLLIKCYKDKKQFENYIKFCNSRRREVLTGMIGDYYTVVFNAYA